MKERPSRRRLVPRDLKLKLSAFYWLWVVRVGLAVLPFPRVLALQQRACRKNGGVAPEAHYGTWFERVSWAVESTDRFVPGAKCLARALVGQILLSQRGISSDLRIGVKREEERGVRAHAWLESNGVPVLGGDPLDQYTPLSSTGTTNR